MLTKLKLEAIFLFKLRVYKIGISIRCLFFGYLTVSGKCWVECYALWVSLSRYGASDLLHISYNFPCDLRVGPLRFVLYIDADGGLWGSLEPALFAAVVVINHGSNNKHQSSAAVAVSTSTFITALVLNQPPIYLSIVPFCHPS